MGRKRRSGERKLRTREHIIEDLSVNYLERRILLRGFSVSRFGPDYGIDLVMFTYNDRGEVENGPVQFQVKATDSPRFVNNGQAISLRLETSDLLRWKDEWCPVIVVLYDALGDRAFWVDIQEYIETESLDVQLLAEKQDRTTIRLSVRNKLTRRTIDQYRKVRDAFLRNRETSKDDDSSNHISTS